MGVIAKQSDVARRWVEKMDEKSLEAFHSFVDALPGAGEEYERQVRRVYEEILEDGDIAVDVGAYEGKHSIPLSLACAPSGKVYIAEPNIGIHPVLRDRLEIARQFGAEYDFFDGCVSDENDQQIEFHVVPDRVGWSSMKVRENVTNTQKLMVSTRKLDTWIPEDEHAKVRFLKTDCEGAERKVLQGASRIRSHNWIVIHLEVSPAALEVFGEDVAAFATELYEAYVPIDCAGHVYESAALLAHGFRTKGVFDFFFLPRGSNEEDELVRRTLAVLRRGFGGLVNQSELADDEARRFLAYGRKDSEPNPIDGERTAFPYASWTPAAALPSLVPQPQVPVTRASYIVNDLVNILRFDDTEFLHSLPVKDRIDIHADPSATFSVEFDGHTAKLEEQSNRTLLEIRHGEDAFLLRLRNIVGQPLILQLLALKGDAAPKRLLNVEVPKGWVRGRLQTSGRRCRIVVGTEVVEFAFDTAVEVHGLLPFSIGSGRRIDHPNAERFEGTFNCALFAKRTAS